MRFALLLVVLALAGCAAPRPAPVAPNVVAPPPRPVPPAPAPLQADWNDWPYTPGDWNYRATADGSTAQFVSPSAATSLSLRCDRARRVVDIVLPSGSTLTIRTTAMTRTLLLRSGEAGVATSVAATDPLLDAMAFSRGRIALERPERAPIVVPPQAEIGRLIEDCRG